MTRELALLLVLLFANLPLVKLACSGEPQVYWSFDSQNTTNLIPKYTKDQRFYSYITGQNVTLVPDGVNNSTGIYVPRSSIVLAKNLKNEDCLLDVNSCFAICMTFYIKLISWSPQGHNHIVATLPSDRRKPGIHIGKGDSNTFMVYIRGQDGTTYETTFSQNYTMGDWARILINWNKESRKIRVEVNDRDLNLETEVGDSGVGGRNSINSELLLGRNQGAQFYFDEFTVYYTRNATGNHTTLPLVQTTIEPSATIKDETATQPSTSCTTTESTITTSSATSVMTDARITGTCIALLQFVMRCR